MHCTVFPAFPMDTYSVFKLKLKYKVNVMEKVNIVALGLSALQKSTLDFAYK